MVTMRLTINTSVQYNCIVEAGTMDEAIIKAWEKINAGKAEHVEYAKPGYIAEEV